MIIFCHFHDFVPVGAKMTDLKTIKGEYLAILEIGKIFCEKLSLVDKKFS